MTGEETEVAEAAAESTEGSARPKRPWYRRPKRVIPLAILVVLLIAAIPFTLAWRNRGAQEASVEESVEEFREENDSATGEGEEAGFLRPEAGVYTYLGDGDEKLSLLDTRQAWGPRMPAVLSYQDDGCWNLRIRYSTNHRQEYHYCPEGTILYEVSGLIFQSFDFVAFTVDDTNVVKCEPRSETIRTDAEPGDSWDAACSGKSRQRGTEYTSIGTNTFIGVETVEIGGEEVEAYRYHTERELAGSQTGTDNGDTWYSVETGLPLKATHDIRVSSPSPIGDVVYTEVGEFTLTSLEPQK